MPASGSPPAVVAASATSRVTARRPARCLASASSGGATVATLLPVQIQGKAVVLGMGGTIDRIRPNKDKYLKLVRDLSASLKPDPKGT